jgi:uncharacterized protein (TIGR00661 family)
MRILYGIQTTGNGHISRSTKIIHRLIKSGCQVDILLSGNNSQLELPFPVKFHMTGFTIKYNQEGRADYLKTFYNLKFLQFLKDIKLDLSQYDKIITDFEPITGWAAKLQERECIGLSNQCSFLSDKTPRPDKKSLVGEFILKNMVPVSKPIGLHFEKYDDFIHTPIIKETMKLLDTTDMGFYLVYLPTYNIESIISRLSMYPKTKFEVFHPNQFNYRIRNIHVRSIHTDLFQENLRHSHGVISAAGFQTTTEALFLKKKLFCIPIKGQWEQECNAIALNNLGVKTGNLEDIGDFLKSENLPKINWEDSTEEIINIILSH